ncbi:MAG: DNA polymerase Y family protein [Pseudomonadota bacterium]
MPHRRILSLWFPRLGAERLLRLDPALSDSPFAVAEARGNMQVLSSLSAGGAAAGLSEGQPLRDAQAMCEGLITRLRNPQAEARFLSILRRWAGKFSPWVAEEAPASLIIDLTGCAHLFGGEEPLLNQVAEDCADMGLTVQAGIADTPGAAWALARFAGQPVAAPRSGDAIDQEAYATRARAAKRRHWERGGPAPGRGKPEPAAGRIAVPGQTRGTIGPLPVAALRLETETVEALSRLGLRRIEDLSGQPRAALARRFGRRLVQRLDQAMGVEPEPVSPAKPQTHFAVRLTLPEPIGLETDLTAAIDRLLPRLETRLDAKGRGARRVRLECHRSDHTMAVIEVGLARPSANPDRIRPLLILKLSDIDAGFGIDCVRIEAVQTEPVYAHQHRGHAEAAADGRARRGRGAGMDDLIGRIGARIGMDAITRAHPADSHIPEKAATRLAAAWSEPSQDWPVPPVPRPLLMWRPEPVTADPPPGPPLTFRWRRRDFATLSATGPERIAPEWWLDEPEWRTGTRDYWRVTTDKGDRLWIYYAHGGTMSAGWFCHGTFA